MNDLKNSEVVSWIMSNVNPELLVTIVVAILVSRILVFSVMLLLNFMFGSAASSIVFPLQSQSYEDWRIRTHNKKRRGVVELTNE